MIVIDFGNCENSVIGPCHHSRYNSSNFERMVKTSARIPLVVSGIFAATFFSPSGLASLAILGALISFPSVVLCTSAWLAGHAITLTVAGIATGHIGLVGMGFLSGLGAFYLLERHHIHEIGVLENFMNFFFHHI